MITIDFNGPAWDLYVNRLCINGLQPPSYTTGNNYIRDAVSGLRIKMIGGSMTVPPRQGSFLRQLFFTYQDCAGQNPGGKSKVVSLIAWFPPPPKGELALNLPLPRFSLLKLILGTTPDPVSTRPLLVNVFGTDESSQQPRVIASRSVPPNGNVTFNFRPKAAITAVEVQTDHIENTLRRIYFDT
jgi:hypothetical protein